MAYLKSSAKLRDLKFYEMLGVLEYQIDTEMHEYSDELIKGDCIYQKLNKVKHIVPGENSTVPISIRQSIQNDFRATGNHNFLDLFLDNNIHSSALRFVYTIHALSLTITPYGTIKFEYKPTDSSLYAMKITSDIPCIAVIHLEDIVYVYAASCSGSKREIIRVAKENFTDERQ